MFLVILWLDKTKIIGQILGGYSQIARDYVDRIWMFNTSWEVIGHMQEKRINFRTVLVHDLAYTVGGLGTVHNEKWSFRDAYSQQLTTSVTYKIFPELISLKYFNCDNDV